MDGSPLPATIGFTVIGGVLGKWIGALQFLSRGGFEKVGDRRRFRWTHVFIVVAPNVIIEAEPGGVRAANLTDYADRPMAFSVWDLTETERHLAVERAWQLRGVPYSYVTYLAFALATWGVRPQWLENYITRSERIVCSQLADECWRYAGVHVFNDGRWPGEVSPSDLAGAVLNPRPETPTP